MKAIKMLMFLLSLFLLSCNMKTTSDSTEKENGSNASTELQKRVETNEYNFYSDNEEYPNVHVDLHKYKVDGIEYHLYERGGKSVFIINHTKELLEVEKLRKEMNK